MIWVLKVKGCRRSESGDANGWAGIDKLSDTAVRMAEIIRFMTAPFVSH